VDAGCVAAGRELELGYAHQVASRSIVQGFYPTASRTIYMDLRPYCVKEW
jgi:hypothetical protein